MKKRILKSLSAFAIASALVLAAAGPGNVLAYFTTHAEAQGVQTINLYYETHIDEDVEAGVKTVSISSEEGSFPVYVRVKVFSEVELSVEPDPAGSWTEGAGGYWYCEAPLEGGGKTADLVISVADKNLKDKYKEGDVFDVIVVYEVTPVVYEPDADGNPKPVKTCQETDWERDVEINTITESSTFHKN